MQLAHKDQIIDKSFNDFVFHSANKPILTLSLIALVLQFTVFKYLYPYASFIHGDSFSYIIAADQNLDINTYMVGYSKFLRLFSVFSTTDIALVGFQYLFIHVSILFLLFTLFYFYTPRKGVQIVLLCFMVFNPLFLHLANLISSDAIFLALSVLWFALLLWIIHKPTPKIIIAHAIVLLLAFTFRYNALIYPFISGLAFWLSSRLGLRKKIIGLATGVLLCSSFVLYTSYKYKQLTGLWQYSPFSGWQLANNAMYAYRYVGRLDRKPVPKKFEQLDNMIRVYFDSTRDVKKHPQEALEASTVYMWTPTLPLFKYRNTLFEKDTAAKELKKWSSMGPFYKEYGLYIIRQYPWHFLKYFIWPNSQKYYAPPVEFLAVYNSGRRSVPKIAQDWFRYSNAKLFTRVKGHEVMVLEFYPILSGIINVIMICALLCYFILHGWKTVGIFRLGILMGALLWFINAGFTIGASSAALRFQSFPLLMTIIFSALLIDWLLVVAFATKKEDYSLTEEQSPNPQFQIMQ
jgi:hypothetical protein